MFHIQIYPKDKSNPKKKKPKKKVKERKKRKRREEKEKEKKRKGNGTRRGRGWEENTAITRYIYMQGNEWWDYIPVLHIVLVRLDLMDNGISVTFMKIERLPNFT